VTSRPNKDEFESLTFRSNKDEFKLIGSFRGVYVTLQPNKDEFETTSGPNMSEYVESFREGGVCDIPAQQE